MLAEYAGHLGEHCCPIMGSRGSDLTDPRPPLSRLTLARQARTLLDGPEFIRKELVSLAPAFTTAAKESVRSATRSMAVTHETLRTIGGPRGDALRLVLSQAANDWIDLVYELMHGRGRAALRAARSMFEHHVTAEAVGSNDGDAQRYVDHLPVADRHFVDLKRVEQHLRGGDLKSHRHEIHKLDRDTRKPADEAIARYGQGFRSSWSAAKLHDRAMSLGLGDDYNFYRVASLPVHGAAAGIYGGKRLIGGHDVYRTGPFLAACPLAAIYGTAFCGGVLRPVADVAGERTVRDWHRAVEDMEGTIGEYMVAITDLDERLWPERAPVNVAPMLVVKSRGESELWLALPEAMLAYDYAQGSYRPTVDQDCAAEKLFQVLSTLDIDRLGVVFVDAWDPTLADVPAHEPKPLDMVIPDAPILIFPDGSFGVPNGLSFGPYLDDILPRPPHVGNDP